MARARYSTVEMTYNSTSADQMMECLSGFQYTDVASGSSDSINVELSDVYRRWITGWFPKKGDRLKPVICRYHWNKDGEVIKTRCGTFVIDDFSFKGGPLRCFIAAVAMPSASGFKATERTATYEKTTLKEIGQKIAARSGLTLFYEAASVSVESVSQDKQSDCAFYSDLVVRYGLALKIFNDRLVVFDEAFYESKPVVATLTEADIEPDWQWNTTLAGTYTGVSYQYTHSDKNKTFKVDIGGGKRILVCNDPANNQTEATLIALAKINNANKNTTTMRLTLSATSCGIVTTLTGATRSIMATDCVQLAGIGQLSGKYYVEQATYSIGDGMKITLNLRKVEKRFTKQSEPSAPVKLSSSTAENKKSAVNYKKGDKVRVTKGAKSYSGGKLASFIFTTVYTVMQVGGKGLPSDRIVLGTNGTIVVAVRAADLYYA